jgi:hypothetical protein
MKALTYSITKEIFQRFPGYVRGVVVAWGVRNRQSPELGRFCGGETRWEIPSECHPVFRWSSPPAAC